MSIETDDPTAEDQQYVQSLYTVYSASLVAIHAQNGMGNTNILPKHVAVALLVFLDDLEQMSPGFINGFKKMLDRTDENADYKKALN